jgi:DNA-binding response OmpR family regulator
VIDKFVLLVEDNPDEAVLAEIAFKRDKVTNKLVLVSDGREALDFLFSQDGYGARDPQDTPALILLDLKLPFVSGLDVLKEIRANQNTASVPVVVLTSSMENADQAESYRLGANDYIRKPTGMSELVEIVKKLKSRWLDST